MNQNLPSYINPAQNRGIAQRALANAPLSSPPYLSIKGNRFTLIDAAGNTRQFQTLYADVVVVDVNDHLSKIYFPDAYVEGDATPPLCFSDNGIAPSRNAGEPQSPTCASCRWGEWGSKISTQGSRIKACTDVQKIAIIVPGISGQEFLLRIPPNSLKNWGGYLATFRYGYDISDVVTRLTFQEGVQGTLEFSPSPEAFLDNPRWAQCQLLQVREQAWANPGVKAMIGGTDVPAEGLVGGPGFRGGPPIGGPALPSSQQATTLAPVQQFVPQQPGFQQPASSQGAPVSYQPASAPNAGFQPTGTAPQQQIAQPAPGVSPSSSPAGRRRRRTQAEIAADNARANPLGGGQALTAPFPHPGHPSAGGQFGSAPVGATAPAPRPAFSPAPPAGLPAAAGSTAAGGFGIGTGVAPDAAMEKMLQETFGPGFRGNQ